MSVSILNLIPDDPNFIPSERARVAALEFLASILPQGTEFKEMVTPHVEFVDQGGNFESIRCPACQQIIDMSWWSRVMDQAYDHDLGFTDLMAQTPCCFQWFSLNKFDYRWPAGFARYRLEMRDPPREITTGHVSVLERTLGCSLRKIWARY